AWLIAEGFPQLARLLRESRRTLEGELRTGRCYSDPMANAELESAGGADALIAAFQGLGDPLPLEDGSDCFAAQLPRVLVRILRALLPLVAAHPPQSQPPRATMETQLGVRGGGGDGDAAATAAAAAAVAAAAAAAAEAALGEALYGLAASTVEILATLAAHGAAAELKAVGLD
ncbi:unnamed protein product, partial [Laminaria digitata]